MSGAYASEEADGTDAQTMAVTYGYSQGSPRRPQAVDGNASDKASLLAAVEALAEHLHPAGCFLFGTRNPSPRNLFEARYPEPKTYTTPDGRQYVATEQQEYDPITQIQHYTFRDQWLNPAGQPEEKMGRTALRYVFPQEMEALLFYNGFQIRSCYGSWQQEPLTATSREMIYVCQRRV